MSSKATQQFVQKCESLFKEAAGADGNVSISELRSLICNLCGNTDISDRMIAEIFADMDDDNDKMLSWEEFSEVCTAKDPKTVQENELRAVFEKIDKNKDKKLTPDEVREAFRELDIKSDPEQSIEACDKDGDGKVSVDEFLKSWVESL